MTNRLADHLTTWKAWYAVLALPALLIGSTLTILGGGGDGEQGGAAALAVPLSFVAFAAVSLGLIALVSRRWPTRAVPTLPCGAV